MKIGILGYGKEGKSVETYFHAKGAKTEVFDNFKFSEIKDRDFSNYDLVFRSPSIHPHSNWTSITKYFFKHCPCPIIGVTGTKGKGTTSSLITSLLKALDKNVYLVGNIGTPALDVLDQLTQDDVVVYELSSFQLWDLDKSPHIAIITNIEPDHLNVHDSYEDYVNAKANITIHQTADDYLIYHLGYPDIIKIAQQSHSHHIKYPSNLPEVDEITSHLAIPGHHNRDNAEAALFAVSSYLKLPINEFIKKYHDVIIKTFENFRGLPHRLEFLRELNGVKYYDDNFSTTPTSLEVALKSFPDQDIILIVGGRDKTSNEDLPEIINLIKTYPAKVILIGESGHAIAKILTKSDLPDRELVNALKDTTNSKFFLADSLPSAITLAKDLADDLHAHHADSYPVVLMSPAAASFDMFENVYARGAEFQRLVQGLSNDH